MKGAPQGNKYAIGNKGGKGGSRKAPAMEEFYAKLDAACLHVVDYLATIVVEAEKHKDDRDWRQDGINAAGKLLVKAPERINQSIDTLVTIKWGNGDSTLQSKTMAEGSP